MSNQIRTRDGLPFDFEDGLKSKGYELDSFDGAKAIAFQLNPTDVLPTLLDTWIQSVVSDILTIKNGGAGTGTAVDQSITNDSSYIANTRFVQAVVTAKLLELVGSAPASLNTLAEIAAAINNDPNFYTTINNVLSGKASLADLRNALSTYAIAGGVADSITAEFTPAVSTLENGMKVRVRSVGANTSSVPTFTPNNGVIAFKQIVKGANIPLEPADIAAAGYPMQLQYDATFDKWVLLNPAYPVSLPYASATEVISGTATNRIITPFGLKSVLDALKGTAPGTLDTLQKLAAALNNDPNFHTTLTNALALKAPLDSPKLTGVPTAPTQATGDNSTNIATTAFVVAAIASALGNVSVVSATAAVKGILALATNAETLAGLLTDKAVSPASLKYAIDNMVAATQSQRSIVSFASDAETITGTDVSKAVTPKSVKYAIDTAFSNYTGSLTPPAAPTLSGSSTVVVGLNYTLSMSSTVTSAGATLVSFDVSVNGGPATTVTATSGAATYTWPSTGTVGSTVSFSVTCKDSNNKVSTANTKAVTLSTITVNTPTISTPAASATSVSRSPSIVSSAFATTGGTDTHLNSDWEIRTGAGGTGTLVWSSLADTTNKTNINVPAGTLAVGTTYYARVRHRSVNYGSSAYAEQTFTTITAPSAPTLSGGTSVIVGQAYALTMSSTATAAGASVVSFNLTIDGGSVINVPASGGSATYNWTAAGTVGNNVTFSVTAFDSNSVVSTAATKLVALTTVTVNTPTITAPSAGATGVSVIPTITTSAFATTGGSDTHASTDWEIRTASGGGGTQVWSSMADSTNKTSISVNSGTLSVGVTYYVRSRHRGTTYGVSAYAENTFTTSSAPSGPTLTGSTATAPGVNYTLSLSASPIAPATSIVSFSVSVDGGVATVVTASGNTGTYTLAAASTSAKAAGASVVFSATALDNTGVTSTASTKTITIAKPNAPTFTTPAAGATGVSITTNIATSAFSVTGGSDTHASTDWEIRTAAAGGGTQIWASATDTANKVAITVPSAKLSNSTTYYLRARYNGATYGSSAYTEITFTTAAKPSGATLSGADSLYSGQDYVLSLSAVATNPATTITSFDVSVDAGAVTTVNATLSGSNYVATYTWPGASSGLKAGGASTVFSVTLKDNTTATSVAVTKTITMVTPTINTPVINSPINASTGVSVTLTASSSAFAVSGGTTTHASSDWEVRTAAGGAGTLVASSLASTTNKTSWTVGAGLLTANNTYYLRVRYTGAAYGSSAYAEVSFTTGATSAPSITAPTAGATGVALTPTVTSTAFVVTGSDVHNSSDWELRTAPNGAGTLVASLTGSTTSKTSWTISTALTKQTQYYVRVRHNGSLSGATAYGESSFTTGYVATPAFTTPVTGATGAALTFTASTTAFASVGTDTHASSDWEVRTAAGGGGTLLASSTASTTNKTTYAIAAGVLSQNTTYYIRVRHNGSNFGGSVYAEASFTTGSINTPTIVSPVNAATGVIVTPTVTSSAFTTNGSDTHLKSDWEIRTAAAGAGTVVASSIGSTTNKTTFTPPLGSLTPGVQYYVRVRYYGTGFGVTSYAESSFTVGSVNTPSAVAPATGGVGAELSGFSQALSAFSTMGGTDSHLSTDYEVRSAAGGAGTLLLSGTVTGTIKTEFPVVAAGNSLAQGTTYYVRFRYNSVGYGTSAWAESNFTTGKLNAGAFVTPSVAGTTGVKILGMTYISSNVSPTGWTDTYVQTDWEFRTAAAGAGTLKHSGTVTTTSYPIPSETSLDPGVLYYVRFRNKYSVHGYTDWTESTITTGVVTAPTITSPAAAATGIAITPTITSSAFASNVVSDTHSMSSWEIRTAAAGGGTLVYSSVDSTTNKTSLTVPAATLSNGTLYYVRVRHKSSSVHYSAWAESTFTTVSAATYSFLQKIYSTTIAKQSANFGANIVANSTGNTLVVASPYENADGETGDVFVWEKSGSTWAKQFQTNIIKSTYKDWLYGVGIAVQDDGNRFVVGSNLYTDAVSGVTCGCAYVYTRSGSTWTQEKLLLPADKTANARFGWACAINALGDTIAIGAVQDSQLAYQTGAVYVFTRSGTTWTQQAKLTPAGLLADDWFGHEIALSADGSTLIVGAITDDTLAADGVTAFTDAGSVYAFVRSGTTWSQQTIFLPPDRATFDYFGGMVDVSADGNTMISSAYIADASGSDSGAVYVFVRSGTTWSFQTKLVSSDITAGAHFGRDVAISANGNRAIIGASHNASNGYASGAAYQYDRVGTTWTQTRKITRPDVVSGDEFGVNTAISGDGTVGFVAGHYATVTQYAQGVVWAFSLA